LTEGKNNYKVRLGDSHDSTHRLPADPHHLGLRCG